MSHERLRASGSCPQVSKRKSSKALVVRGFRSSTSLQGMKSKKMRRLKSHGSSNVSDQPPRNTQRQVHLDNDEDDCGPPDVEDIFDFIPKRCVQVRPIRSVAVVSKGSTKKSNADDESSGTSKLLSAESSQPSSSFTSSAPSPVARPSNRNDKKKTTPRQNARPISGKSANTLYEDSAPCSAGSLVRSRHLDVIVRIRPKIKQEDGSKIIVWKTTSTELLFDPKEEPGDFYYKGKKQLATTDFGRRRNKNLSFAFDYVYGPESTNLEMFNTSLKKLIDQVLDGYNCTVFAYGSTASGKTYTMAGSTDNPGICVLMAEELYRRLDGLSKNYSTDVSVSYLEVYNETIKDLLKPDKELNIREDGKKGIIIPDLTSHTPRGPQDLLRLLRTGNNARSQHATDLNSESSRSHAVFQISVVLRRRSDTSLKKSPASTSRLFMVDLAGSEKGTTGSYDGARQREGANINKSLLALSNCINALADGKSHIPFRNSKLTRLLKDSLSGNCVTVMIANVSPSEFHFEDTHNTLHYANRAKNIKIKCKQNYSSEELIQNANAQVQIGELREQILVLTRQLEVERAKYKTIKEHQMAKGDSLRESEGLGYGAGESSFINPNHHHQHSLSSSLSPAIVNHLKKLMARKAKLVGEFAESCVESRLHEWQMNWKKLRVDVADFIGKVDVTDPHFIALAKLKNAKSHLVDQYPELLSLADERKAYLSTCNKEITKHMSTSLKNGEVMKEPFISLTFKEFLAQKEMEIENITSQKLYKFHQKMNETLLRELMNKEVHSIHLLKCLQNFRSLVSLPSSSPSNHKESLSREYEKCFQSLLSPVYGSPFNFQPPTQNTRAKFSVKEDLSNLEKTLTRPVLDLFPYLGAAVMSNTSWTSGRLDAADTSSKDTASTARASSDEDDQPYLGENNFDAQGDMRFTSSLENNVGSDPTTSTTFTATATTHKQQHPSKTFTDSSKQHSKIPYWKNGKPLGYVKTRISPGSSFLITHQLEQERPNYASNNNTNGNPNTKGIKRRMKHGGGGGDIRGSQVAQSNNNKLRTGKAFTNLTSQEAKTAKAAAAADAEVVSTDSSRSFFDLDNTIETEGRCNNKPQIIPATNNNKDKSRRTAGLPDNLIVQTTSSTFSFSELSSCASNT